MLEKQLGKLNPKPLLAFFSSQFPCRIRMLLPTDSHTLVLISNVCLLT